MPSNCMYSTYFLKPIHHCPKGFCAGGLKILMCVCPSVCLCVCPCVTLRFDHFLDPVMCDIALNNSIDRKMRVKKSVPLDPVRKQILMWKKVCQKVSNPIDVGDITLLRFSCAKALWATLPYNVIDFLYKQQLE